MGLWRFQQAQKRKPGCGFDGQLGLENKGKLFLSRSDLSAAWWKQACGDTVWPSLGEIDHSTLVVGMRDSKNIDFYRHV